MLLWNGDQGKIILAQLHKLWQTAYILEWITSQQPASKSGSEMTETYKSKLLKILQFYKLVYV